MSENLLENFTDQAKNFSEPLAKINKLIISNLEKVAEFQMDAAKSYADITMKQFKELSEIRDIDALKNFGTSQSEAASNIAKKLMEDVKTLGEMGNEFKNEVEGIISEAKAGSTEESKEEA